MLYFAVRFDEVPVRSLTKHLSIPCVIISASRPKKFHKTEPVKWVIKTAFILDLVELWEKRIPALVHCSVGYSGHVSPSYIDLVIKQVCLQS